MSRKQKKTKRSRPRHSESVGNPLEEALSLIKRAKESKSTDLHIHIDNLEVLPAEVGELSWLETLCLHSNRLTDLPPSLTKLKSLKEIRLDGNEFTRIPDVIYDISTLDIVDLSSNNISEISDRLEELTHLSELNLSDNDFKAPAEIFGQSTEEVVRFLLNFKRGEIQASMKSK